jgi:putative spermidine/putrescine transport system permease protein
MTAVTTSPEPPSAAPAPAPDRRGPLFRVSAFFYRHPRLRLLVLLAPPLLWLGVVYLGSLIALLVQSFYKLDDFSGIVLKEFTLDTWEALNSAANRDIVGRTVVMSAAVTVVSIVIAFPIAYFMTHYARPAVRTALFIAVLVPLWSSYLVRVYSWKLILAKEGVLPWFADQLGLTFVIDALLDIPGWGGSSLSVSRMGQLMVFTYIWLPFMIIPIATALERVPIALIDASRDLGARPATTFRRVIWPLALPGVVAGSIFTFSLTLGDYIIPQVIGDSRFSIGLAIYVYQGASGNLPLAAAFTVVPIAIMAIYLFTARRMGAFEAM